jgi:kynurenine formamidase
MQYRVLFDFEIDFSNGGGLKGHDFRLDIAGDDIGDAALADAIVRDLRLLMVGAVRIGNKRIIAEPHKRREPERGPIDLSHPIEDGMLTYPGLPAPAIRPFLTREASRAHYAPGTEFHIGRIDMVANTGTYLDTPFHRFAGAADLATIDLALIADLPAMIVRASGMATRAIDRAVIAATLANHNPAGAAVLIHTGWAAHWGTGRYFDGHPFLTADAAHWLIEQRIALCGIDSLNIDDTSGGARPVHSALLGAGIPIVEHLRGLEQLPTAGFRFSAVPAPVRGLGSFPVRAYAIF